MVDRFPAYCDFGRSPDSFSLEQLTDSPYPTVVFIQAALNTAIPACSLCINRRLYKIATMKAVMITRDEKRRAVIQDLFICKVLPILQALVRKCT